MNNKFYFPLFVILLCGLGIYGVYELSIFVNDLSKKSSEQLFNGQAEFVSNSVYEKFITELSTKFPNNVLLESFSVFPLESVESVTNYNSISNKAIGENGLVRIFITERTDNEMEEQELQERLRSLYYPNITFFSTGELDDSGFKWIQLYTYPPTTNPETVGIIVNSDPGRSSIISRVYNENQTTLEGNVTSFPGEKGIIISVPIIFDDNYRVRRLVSQLFDFKPYFDPQFSSFRIQQNTRVQITLQGSIIYETFKNGKNLNKVFNYPDISLVIKMSDFDDSSSNIFNFVFVPGTIGTLLLSFLFIFFHFARLSAIKHSEYSTRFIANISHEIRTPLNGILGVSEIMSQKMESQDVKSIRSCANSLMFIINNVLENSSINKGTFSLNILEINLFELLLNSMDETWRTYQKEEEISLILSFGKGIPEKCICDGYRISHVFSNILSNAIKFTPSGNINVNIWGVNDMINCEIKDTGIGMDDKLIKSLFTSFDRSEGTGLGLTVSRKIARVMGGDVSCIESKINIGTTFMFTFKVKNFVNNDYIHPNTTVFNKTKINTNTKKYFDIENENENEKRVLIVDDIPLNRKIVERIIKSLEIDFDSCENGLEAVKMCEKKKYKTIFMDNMMPVMGGEEATREIRKGSLNKETPIIFISANVQPNVIDRCLKCGGNGFLPKPITRNAIILALT